MVGGLENLEIKGAPFQVRPPNFSGGLDSHIGTALLDLKIPIFQNFSPAAGYVSLVLHF